MGLWDNRLKIKRIDWEKIILHEDEHLLVLDKPKGVSSLAERIDPNSGMLEMAKNHFGLPLQLCHRLDKMTTGVLVFAKNPETYREISLQFQKKKVKKRYEALVWGIHYFDNYLIDLPLKITSKGVKVDFEEGKRTETLVHTLKHYRHFSLVQCEPLTGRTHQIRAHLALKRAPIVGDIEYGGQDLFLSELKRKYQLSKNQEHELSLNHAFLLHAQSLTLIHPQTQHPLTITAPRPKNFQVCLKMLDTYDKL